MGATYYVLGDGDEDGGQVGDDGGGEGADDGHQQPGPVLPAAQTRDTDTVSTYPTQETRSFSSTRHIAVPNSEHQNCLTSRADVIVHLIVASVRHFSQCASTVQDPAARRSVSSKGHSRTPEAPNS